MPYFKIETDKLALKTPKIDKLQFFLQKCKRPTLLSYRIEGIGFKMFFDDSRAHYTGGGS